MSKWNVKTTDGRIADVKQVTQALAPSAADLEASNPKYTGKQAYFAPQGDLYDANERPTCMRRCGACLDTRRGKVLLALCLLFIVTVGVLAAILIPRIPEVVVDKGATAQAMRVRRALIGIELPFKTVRDLELTLTTSWIRFKTWVCFST